MKISIITVCLNSESTIEQTIQSVIEQKNTDCEYVIIDGGSSDHTLDIVKKYKEKIDIIVSEPDDGIYNAMNKGIALSSGDVIGIINSDDWYEPQALEKVKNCFLETNADVVYGKLNLISIAGEISTFIPGEIEKMRYEMATPHPTVFVKKDVYEKHGAFRLEYKIAADYELMLRLYTSGVKFYYCDKILANFRTGGISSIQERKCIEETLLISWKYLSSAPNDSYEYLKNIILNKWKGLLFLEILDEYPDKLLEIIDQKRRLLSYDDVAIFGAGNWGTKISKILSRSNIQALFFVDNDPQKWGKKKWETEIFPPEVLKSFKGLLVLAIEKFTVDILHQVEKIHNRGFCYITWEEIVDEIRDCEKERRKIQQLERRNGIEK